MTYPQDRTLAEVLDAMASEGFAGDFTALEGGEVRCLACRETWPADQLDGDRSTRLEGASDPDEMAIVIPGTCPSCGTKGTVVAKFGPEASAAEADVVLAIDRRPASPAEQGER
jgi:hypothetical protein